MLIFRVLTILYYIGVDKPVQTEEKLEYIPQMLSRVRPTETIQEMATRSLINYSMNGKPT